jgi:hypothetical protein
MGWWELKSEVRKLGRWRRISCLGAGDGVLAGRCVIDTREARVSKGRALLMRGFWCFMSIACVPHAGSVVQKLKALELFALNNPAPGKGRQTRWPADRQVLRYTICAHVWTGSIRSTGESGSSTFEDMRFGSRNVLKPYSGAQTVYRELVWGRPTRTEPQEQYA